MLMVLLILAMFFGTAAFAWHWGGSPEKCGAIVLLAIFALGVLRRLWVGNQSDSLDLVGLVSDIAVFVSLMAIAQFAWRIWPIWAASLQLLAVFAHAIHGFGIEIHPMVYTIMRTAPTYLIWLVLCLGTWTQHKRSRANGNLPSWRSWSRR